MLTGFTSKAGFLLSLQMSSHLAYRMTQIGLLKGI